MTPPKIKWYYRIVNDEIVKSRVLTANSFEFLVDAKNEFAKRLAVSIREMNKRRFEVWKLTKNKIKEV